MPFAIKAEVRDPRAKTFVFAAQKTMYGGKGSSNGIAAFASAYKGHQHRRVVESTGHGF